MRVYILNTVGKKIFILARAREQSAPSAATDIVIELHKELQKNKPKKGSDVVASFALNDNETGSFEKEGTIEKISLKNKLGWTVDCLKYSDKDGIYIKLLARNGNP